MRQISARISLSTTRFPLNSYVRIPCDVNSGLRPSISWLKDGAPLDSNARVRVLFNNTLAIDLNDPMADPHAPTLRYASPQQAADLK